MKSSYREPIILLILRPETMDYEHELTVWCNCLKLAGVDILLQPSSYEAMWPYERALGHLA